MVILDKKEMKITKRSTHMVNSANLTVSEPLQETVMDQIAELVKDPTLRNALHILQVGTQGK